MVAELPQDARELLDARVFAVLSTVSASGAPQSSVIWVKRDGADTLFSTIEGRLKTRNMQRNPRVSLCLYDPEDPYVYAEIRGEVTMTTEGGDALIDELSQAYDNKPWKHRPNETRLVCRVAPTKVITRVTAQSKRHAAS